MTYKTIQVEFQGSICFVKINLPETNNAISSQFAADFHEVLNACESAVTVVVLSGLPHVFCSGADFKTIAADVKHARQPSVAPETLYELWLRLATGPYVTISHVRGKVSAGGLGFVAASDIVLADETAQFSLPELLFGLYPACVLPFLVRKVGFQKAHYLTLMTQPISVKQACDWGLVDATESLSDVLVRRHLHRLRCLSKTAVRRYKKYMVGLGPSLQELNGAAVRGNREVFSDRDNLRAITRFVEQGLFPWEGPPAGTASGSSDQTGTLVKR